MLVDDEMSKITITNRIQVTQIEAKSQIEEEKDEMWRIKVPVNELWAQIRHVFDVRKSLLQQRQRCQQSS